MCKSMRLRLLEFRVETAPRLWSTLNLVQPFLHNYLYLTIPTFIRQVILSSLWWHIKSKPKYVSAVEAANRIFSLNTCFSSFFAILFGFTDFVQIEITKIVFFAGTRNLSSQFSDAIGFDHGGSASNPNARAAVWPITLKLPR